MKNAGVGVGIPDTGRVKLIVGEDAKLHIFTGASCIGQGLGTVLVQMIVENTDLSVDEIVYERSNTWISPDSGTTSGSRQTLVTGEACRRACEKLMEEFCTAAAIHVQDGCAVINTEYCLSCGMCIVKCPRGAIVDRRGIIIRK